MNGTLKTIILLACLGLGYYGYNKDLSPIPNVEVVDEVFPDAPKQEYQEILGRLDSIVTDPSDALVFSRACRDFGKLTGRDANITTLGQFDQVRLNAFRSLLLNTEVEGKYKGAINEVMRELYQAVFSYLKTDKGISSAEMDVVARKNAVDYFNALSWKFAVLAGVK